MVVLVMGDDNWNNRERTWEVLSKINRKYGIDRLINILNGDVAEWQKQNWVPKGGRVESPDLVVVFDETGTLQEARSLIFSRLIGAGIFCVSSLNWQYMEAGEK